MSSSGPGAIVNKSRAAHRVLIMCNMPCAMWYEGTARLLGFTDLKYIYFSFILSAEPFTIEVLIFLSAQAHSFYQGMNRPYIFDSFNCREDKIERGKLILKRSLQVTTEQNLD